MNSEPAEKAVLENAVAELQAEGYEVYVHPSKHLLPEFLRGVAPDAIALGDTNLVVEIVREGATTQRKLDELSKLVSNQKDWDLRVYLVSPGSASKAIEGVSYNVIELAIRNIEEFAQEGRLAPSLLMAWATFEALARALLPEKFVKPQTPGRLIEVLASNGQITPTEADHLRSLASLRNGLIHGELQITPSKTDMDKFITILKMLLQALPRS